MGDVYGPDWSSLPLRFACGHGWSPYRWRAVHLIRTPSTVPQRRARENCKSKWHLIYVAGCDRLVQLWWNHGAAGRRKSQWGVDSACIGGGDLVSPHRALGEATLCRHIERSLAERLLVTCNTSVLGNTNRPRNCSGEAYRLRRIRSCC